MKQPSRKCKLKLELLFERDEAYGYKKQIRGQYKIKPELVS